jgi:hypothetical protein
MRLTSRVHLFSIRVRSSLYAGTLSVQRPGQVCQLRAVVAYKFQVAQATQRRASGKESLSASL